MSWSIILMHQSDKQKLENKKNNLNRWTFEEIYFINFFFNKQAQQCLERIFWNTCEIQSCFFIFFILIFSNYKLVNLLVVIHLLARVFIFSKYALFVFLSEMQVPFYFTPFYFIIFCCVHQISLYQNLCEFAQRTLFLNFDMKHMTTVIFLRSLFCLWCFSSDAPCSYFFLCHQGLQRVMMNDDDELFLWYGWPIKGF